MMVPHLPADEIRHAIEAGDWPRATGLLGGHQQDLALALANVDRTDITQEAWLDLLQAQRALLAELRIARKAAADALAQLAADHRGARGWLKELA